MTQAAILIPCLLTGGTEVATFETALALQALGIPPQVVVYYDEVDRVMLQTFAAANIPVQCLHLSRARGVAGVLRLSWRLQRCLRKGGYSLIWIQYMTPSLIPLLVSRFFSRRLIAAVHVAARHYQVGDRIRLRWLARRWCDRFVCVSQTTAMGLFGDALDLSQVYTRVRVLPNAIDRDVVDSVVPHEWRQDLGLPESVQLIGYVGRLAAIKGVDVLLRAAAQLAFDRPLLHWIIVGDGQDRPWFEKLSDELGLSAVVHFVGTVPRECIYAVIKGFDLVIVPSREEGFGLSALEAMACGVPLVASRVDALQEVVLEGQTGLLFEPETPIELVSCVERLLNNRGLRQNLATAGLKHVHQHYDRITWRKRLAEVVGEIA